MKKFIAQLCELLAGGDDFVLVSIYSQSGSTPRLAGAKMAVLQSGAIIGTIGGGLVEAKAIDLARDCFDTQGSMFKSFDLTNSQAAIHDMICGGTMEVVFEFVGATETNKGLFQNLFASLSGCRRVTMVSGIDAAAEAGRVGRFLVDDQGNTCQESVPKELLAEIKNIRSSNSDFALIVFEKRRYFISYFPMPGELFFVGAGHVAACAAEVAVKVGFRVRVLDDRQDFANEQRFPTVDEVKVLANFTSCFTGYEITEDSYLIIVTRGHIHDYEVLAQALQTRARYIGMIGSRKKRNIIYAKLLEGGVARQELERVCCPIGLPIEADTPEEIAISIVAELVLHRARRKING